MLGYHALRFQRSAGLDTGSEFSLSQGSEKIEEKYANHTHDKIVGVHVEDQNR